MTVPKFPTQNYCIQSQIRHQIKTILIVKHLLSDKLGLPGAANVRFRQLRFCPPWVGETLEDLPWVEPMAFRWNGGHSANLAIQPLWCLASKLFPYTCLRIPKEWTPGTKITFKIFHIFDPEKHLKYFKRISLSSFITCGPVEAGSIIIAHTKTQWSVELNM